MIYPRRQQESQLGYIIKTLIIKYHKLVHN